MKLGNRDIKAFVVAPFQKQHYVAAMGMFRTYRYPLDAYVRYLFGVGSYPVAVPVRTPIGDIELMLYTAHDILTINEIFCRKDYRADPGDEVMVDFGSNIGISAAYFLSRNYNSYSYLYEPVPQNTARLRKNLTMFEGRYSLSEAAVGEANGRVEFGCEETGRYGGVGRKTGTYMSVECLDSNEVLKGVLAKHKRINILKIDIETLEKQVTERIPVEVLSKIDKIYVEYRFTANPLEETHSYYQYGSVAQFFKKS